MVSVCEHKREELGNISHSELLDVSLNVRVSRLGTSQGSRKGPDMKGKVGLEQ